MVFLFMDDENNYRIFDEDWMQISSPLFNLDDVVESLEEYVDAETGMNTCSIQVSPDVFQRIVIDRDSAKTN